MDTIYSIAEPPIDARRAPDDFPEALPGCPPTLDQTYQILELWSNVRSMARLGREEWGDVLRCKYMIWMLDDGRQYRVMWDAESGTFETQLRRGPNNRIEKG